MTDKPEVMNGESLDIAAQRRAELKQLFPGVFTETQDANGKIVSSIDLERLKAELGSFSDIYEGRRERYSMEWPGKRDCMRVIQEPSRATLRPCVDESLDWDTTRNIFVEGDNLEVLKVLQKSYYGKVKIIYIDPPYNTGKEFIYPDNFSESLQTYLTYSGLLDADGKKFTTNTGAEGRYHSKWLNMIYPRLYVAKNLLRDDGVIFISIDEKEHANLIKICFEIFGEENYCGEIVWKNSSKNDQSYISIQHEYMLCFVKDKNFNKGLWETKKQGLDEIYKMFDSLHKKHGDDWLKINEEAKEWYKSYPESSPIYASKHYNWMDKKGVYFASDISGPNVGQYVYDVVHPKTGKVVKAPARGWSCPESKLLELINKNLVHFGSDESTVPCLKTYLKETEYTSLTSILFKDGRAASKRLKLLFGEQVFTNPKDEDVLCNLVRTIGVLDNDIVLDFFAGSASFAHAMYQLMVEDRVAISTISVQLPEDLNSMLESATGLSKKIIQNSIDYLREKNLPLNLAELSKARIKLVSHKFRNEFNCDGLDLGVKVFKLNDSCFSKWSSLNIKTETDLVGQLELNVDNVLADVDPLKMLYEVLLKSGFELTVEIEKISIAGNVIYSIASGSLLICLEEKITSELIDAVIKLEPMQFICLDKGFQSNDQLKANTAQAFKSRSQQSGAEMVFKVI